MRGANKLKMFNSYARNWPKSTVPSLIWLKTRLIMDVCAKPMVLTIVDLFCRFYLWTVTVGRLMSGIFFLNIGRGL